jgi:type I restriction enzyme S subunit
MWESILAKDYCESVRDGTHDTPKPVAIGGKPLVTSKHIKSGEVDFKSAYHISLEDFDKINERSRVDKWDVLMSMIGTVGECAVIKKEADYAIKNLALFKMGGDKTRALWLYYFLRSPMGQGQLRANYKGASQQFVSLTQLRNLEIPLPPLPVQRRIADILSAYDDLIENNRRRIAILEETARLAYRKWFGGAEQGRAATLGEICREVRRGVRPDAIAPDTPYIGLEHMPRRSISLCEWELAQKVTSTKLAFEAGDILFGKIRPYFHKVGITFVDGVASSDAIVIKPLRTELYAYVLMTVSSDAFVAAASQGMKEGSKMPRADWKQLLNYSVAMPDDDTLAEFNNVLNPILEQLKTLCFSIRNLAAARDMLLPRLMKGGVVS